MLRKQPAKLACALFNGGNVTIEQAADHGQQVGAGADQAFAVIYSNAPNGGYGFAKLP